MALPQPITPTYELVIPSTGKTVKFRTFLVKEEKILLLAEQSEDEKTMKDAIVQIVKNCIISRIKVEDLTYFDLEYIFLQLRARSLEEFLDMEITCRDDGKTKVNHRINLLEVEVDGRNGKGDNKIILDEDTNFGIIMKYPGLYEFVKFVGLRLDFDDEEVSEYIASNIEQIFTDEKVEECSDYKPKEIVDWVEKLTQKQFNKIADFYENQPRLRYKFKITNPNTGVEDEYVLEGLLNFTGG